MQNTAKISEASNRLLCVCVCRRRWWSITMTFHYFNMACSATRFSIYFIMFWNCWMAQRWLFFFNAMRSPNQIRRTYLQNVRIWRACVVCVCVNEKWQNFSMVQFGSVSDNGRIVITELQYCEAQCVCRKMRKIKTNCHLQRYTRLQMVTCNWSEHTLLSDKLTEISSTGNYSFAFNFNFVNTFWMLFCVELADSGVHL